MRNPNFARALTRAQNSGPPFHKILDPPLSVMDDITLSQSELAEEVSSSDENLQTGGDVPSDDDQGPSTSLACTWPHLSIC